MAEDTKTNEEIADAVRVLAIDLQIEGRGIASLAEAIDKVIDCGGLSRDDEEHVLQYLRYLENAAVVSQEKAHAIELAVSKLV